MSSYCEQCGKTAMLDDSADWVERPCSNACRDMLAAARRRKERWPRTRLSPEEAYSQGLSDGASHVLARVIKELESARNARPIVICCAGRHGGDSE